MTNETIRPVALTGDRTTGPLHLGHYAGSLQGRVAMQDSHDLTVMLADTQALTDNGRDPGRLRANVLEVMADYLAVGLDPSRTTIFLQSGAHALARLSMHYLTLVTVSRLERNGRPGRGHHGLQGDGGAGRRRSVAYGRDVK
jgi:tryptophanyl-tRNA synthetase